MKSYLILVSLIAIFVVGGIGMFIPISDTSNSKQEIELNPSSISSENEITRHRFSTGSEWAIEYEYSTAFFPITEIEKMISENIISNAKIKITGIESIEDYQKRFGGGYSTPLQNTDINYTHAVFIEGSWNVHQLTIIQEIMESIQGIKNVKIILVWEE